MQNKVNIKGVNRIYSYQGATTYLIWADYSSLYFKTIPCLQVLAQKTVFIESKLENIIEDNFREDLSGNMRDKELSAWTCQGIKSAFFVATIDDVVVGTAAYKIKVCYTKM